MEQQVASADARKPASPIKRFLPIGILILGLIAFFVFGRDYVSFATLSEHEATLSNFVAANAIVASVLYMAAYAVAIAFSLPTGALLTLIGGLLFGFVWGSVLVVFGATIGATCLFLAAKTALGDTLREKAGPWMAKLEDGFREDAVSYLFTLRLIPIVPFWLVNLVPAFFGVSLRVFVMTTFLGIIPGTLVYVSVGNGIGALIRQGAEPEVGLGLFLKPEILLPIAGLIVLSLVPVVYKKMKARKA